MHNIDSAYHHYWELHCDGLVEFSFISTRSHSLRDENSLPLFSDWPIVMFANLVMWADRIRRQTHAPTAEYAIEAEIYITGDDLEVVANRHYLLGTLDPGSTKLPRYTLGNTDEIIELLSLFHRDFWNSFGRDINDEENVLEISGLVDS